MISVGDARALKLWMACFGAYSAMTPADIEIMEKEAAESAERELLRASAVDSSDEDEEEEEEDDEDEDEEEEEEEEEEQPMAPPPLPPLRLSLHSPRTSPSPTGSAESEDGEGMTVFIVRSPLAPVRTTRNHSLALCALRDYC